MLILGILVPLFFRFLSLTQFIFYFYGIFTEIQDWKQDFTRMIKFWGENIQIPQNIWGSVIDITVFTLSIRTPQLLTIYVLKFEPVQFTTRCCV